MTTPSTPPPAEPTTPPRRRPWWRRWWAIVIAVAVVGLIIDVSVNGGGQPDTSAAPPASSSAPATTTTAPAATTPARTTQRPATTTPRPAAPADTLTGYGATVGRWDATHTPDANYAAGSAYDPDPALPPANGRAADRYVGVQPLGGRVTDYEMNLAPMSLATAETVIAKEFPADTRVMWSQPLPTCTLVEYASPTLHALLGHTDPGDVQVVYASQAKPGQASTVDEATFSDLPGAAPDPAASC